MIIQFNEISLYSTFNKRHCHNVALQKSGWCRHGSSINKPEATVSRVNSRNQNQKGTHLHSGWHRIVGVETLTLPQRYNCISVSFNLGRFSFITLHYSLPEFPRSQLLVHSCSLFKKWLSDQPQFFLTIRWCHTNFFHPYVCQIIKDKTK